MSISGEGISEEVVEKSVGPAPTMVDGKEENSTMPRPQSVSGPESFAFRNVEAEKVESVSATTTQKPGIDLYALAYCYSSTLIRLVLRSLISTKEIYQELVKIILLRFYLSLH